MRRDWVFLWFVLVLVNFLFYVIYFSSISNYRLVNFKFVLVIFDWILIISIIKEIFIFFFVVNFWEKRYVKMKG